MQKKLFKYSGKEALVLQETTTYNWKETGIVYWRGKKIKRDSKEYDDIILNKYLSWINSIVPNNIDHLFADDEERQNVREQWRYNY